MALALPAISTRPARLVAGSGPIRRRCRIGPLQLPKKWRYMSDMTKRKSHKGRKPAEVASQEAYEEAGLIGKVVGKRPLGNFHYEKRLAKKAVICEVLVFLFRVERQLDDWPEKGERKRQWVDVKQAAALVEEGGLAEIIDLFASSYVRFVGPRPRRSHGIYVRRRAHRSAASPYPEPNLLHS